MVRSYSGLVEDFLLLLLKFFLSQNAGFSQLSEQPELGKLIALCVGLGLALLRLVLPLLSSKQIAQTSTGESEAVARRFR